jgi:hypothetical protein
MSSDALVSALQDFVAHTPDSTVRRQAMKLRDRLVRRPMDEILNRVPGDNVAAKARTCGATRQTYYSWLDGVRPTIRHATKLAQITGFSVAEIRGDGRSL